MEQNSPSAPPIRKEPSKKLQEFLPAVLIEGLILIVVLITVSVVLNYFGVIPLSNSAPKIFGFLPQKESSSQTVSTSTVETVVPTVPPEPVFTHLFRCPILVDDCSAGIQIYDPRQQKMTGVAYKELPALTSVLAVVKGQYSVSESIVEGLSKTTVTVLEEEGDMRITYLFQGKKNSLLTQNSGVIEDRHVLGVTDGEKIKMFEFSNEEYSLYVSVENATTGDIIPIKAAKDGKGLEL